MEVTLKRKLNWENAAEAAAKSHGKNLSCLDRLGWLEYVEKWAPKHRNVAEHMVYAIDIVGITRAASEILGETKFGFTMTEMSQRYREVMQFAHYHPYNEIAKEGYDKLQKDYKWKKQDARYVLPVTAATEMHVTLNREALFDAIGRLLSVGKYDMDELAHELATIASEDIKSDLGCICAPSDDILGTQKCPEVSVFGPHGYEVLHAVDVLSVSAYQQLKRHRTTTVTKRGLPTGFFYSLGFPAKGRDLYLSTMYQGDEILKNGDMRWFLFQMPFCQLENFFGLRCDSHAQLEIREWATSVKKYIKSEGFSY